MKASKTKFILLTNVFVIILYASLPCGEPMASTMGEKNSENNKIISTGVLSDSMFSSNTFLSSPVQGPLLIADSQGNQPAPSVSNGSESAVPYPPLQSSPSMRRVAQTQDEIKYNIAGIQAADGSGKPWNRLVKASALMPVYDKDFRDFVDYGLSLSFGLEKRISPKISVVGEAEFILMRGDWSTKGDRASLKIAAEEITYSSNPNIQVLSPEEVLPEDMDETQGAGYWSGGTVNIDSAESLKTVDIETTMFLIPVSINGYYWPLQGKKFNPYIGGGVGYCIAQRYADSNAIKEKHFEGPEYLLTLNESEFNYGLFLQMVAGVYYPIRSNVIFIAQGRTAFYNMKSFDPVFTVSFKDESRSLEDPSIVTYSYEKPIEIGVIEDIFVSSLTVGIVIPF